MGRQRDLHAASGLAGADHDDRAIGQGDGQVGQRCLGQSGGVHQHTTGFGDGRGGAQGQGRRAQRITATAVAIGQAIIVGQPANGVVLRRSGQPEASSREANGRIHPACGFLKLDEAVAAPGGTARTCCGRAGSGGFQVGGRVDTGGNGLLQFSHRGRGLRAGLGQIGAGVRCGTAPLSVAAKVEGTPVGQLQSDGTRWAGIHLITHEQAVAFDEYAPDSFRGNYENLTDNAFDDGNNTAHWGLSGVPLI